jgi:hypothetical protein
MTAGKKKSGLIVWLGAGTTFLLAGALVASGQGCDDTKVSGSGGTGSGGRSGGSGGASTGTGGGGGAGVCSGGQEVFVPADPITADVTWSRCNTYMLAEAIIPVRAPAVLTIEPGTTIKALGNTSLVITRGAKIVANGTKEEPIVFTSANTEGSRAPSDWGGLIIMGKAPINVNAGAMPPSVEATFEAFGAADPDGLFGGSDPEDSSGSLKYVRVEFGGKAYTTNREWNNFTFCGVGRGTAVEFLQSHKGADDGIEFFGGTVGVKRLVLSQNQDDGLDTDNGWQGKAQFVVVQNNAPMGTDASNGYESDNQATGVTDPGTMVTAFVLQPRTLPTIYNVTMIGKKDYVAAPSFGAILRRGTGGKYYNHIIASFSSGVLEVRDTSTVEQVTAGNLFIKSSIFFDNKGADGNWPAPTASDIFDEKAAFTAADWMNREVDPMLTDATSLAAPSFKPMAGSPALTGGAAPPDDGFFETDATFVGAVGADDWTAGWTSYPQN